MRISPSIRSLPLVIVMLAISSAAFAQIGIAVRIGPPALPVYEQPLCPGDGFLWTPGYWAYDYDISDYYWVPGTWVEAPEVGFLWTPGYWGWGDGGYLFHTGYWGPHIGFYGGINYGFGYFGNGFEGGRWDNGHFFYNRSVSNVNVTVIHNVYNTTVVNNTTINRVSYNGGNGGIEARATAEQEAAEREHHISPVAAQTEHMQAARSNQQLRASVNRGRPPIAATDRPGAFNGRGAVPAREAGAPYKPAANRPEENRSGNEPRNEPAAHPENNPGHPAMHASELPAAERPAAPNTGNAKADKKYQQQQDKMYAKQNQERQKLQQQQDRDHQKMAQQANQARTQQLEQKHQQQTQQLQQRHASQQQNLQQRQQPAHTNPERKR